MWRTAIKLLWASVHVAGEGGGVIKSYDSLRPRLSWRISRTSSRDRNSGDDSHVLTSGARESRSYRAMRRPRTPRIA
jgi:hypothetical protein